MIGRKIINVKDATLAEVAEILGSVEETELGFEQARTLEYAKKMKKLSKEKENSLIEELLAAVAKIDRTKAVKIADLLPESESEVRAIFAKEIYSLTEEEVTKIIDIVKKYKE